MSGPNFYTSLTIFHFQRHQSFTGLTSSKAKMNIVSTKTNAAALLTGQCNRRPSRARLLYSRAKTLGQASHPSPALRAPSPLRGERDGVRGAFERGNQHVTKLLRNHVAPRFAYAPVLDRRTPAFAPLHRFINCLLAEASDRTG